VALLLLLLRAGWIDARGFFDRGHGLPLALLCETIGHAIEPKLRTFKRRRFRRKVPVVCRP
jgi:hypothetical protein